MVAKFNNLSKPYAKAIFMLAMKENSIKHWKEQLNFCVQISKIMFQKRKKYIYLNKYQLSEIFISIGENYIHQKTKNLIKIMAVNNRLPLFPDVLYFFCNLNNYFNNTIHVEIISTYQLELNFLNILHNKLLKYFSKKIIFKHTIEKSIIGGLIIKTNNEIIDCSILNQIKKLTNILHF